MLFYGKFGHTITSHCGSGCYVLLCVQHGSHKIVLYFSLFYQCLSLKNIAGTDSL